MFSQPMSDDQHSRDKLGISSSPPATIANLAITLYELIQLARLMFYRHALWAVHPDKSGSFHKLIIFKRPRVPSFSPQNLSLMRVNLVRIFKRGHATRLSRAFDHLLAKMVSPRINNSHEFRRVSHPSTQESAAQKSNFVAWWTRSRTVLGWMNGAKERGCSSSGRLMSTCL